MLGIPEPQHSQGRVLLDDRQGRQRATSRSRSSALNDFHGQLEPDDARLRQRHLVERRRRRATWPRCSTRSSRACQARACCSPPATTSAPPRRTRACSRTCRRSTSRTLWGLDATSLGNHEFDYGVERLARAHRAGELPVPRHERRRDGDRRDPAAGSTAVGRVHGQRHQGRRHRRRARGDPRAGLRGRHGGPHVPRRGAADQAESERLKNAGRQRPDRRHPRGHRGRPQRRRPHARPCPGRARSSRSPTSSRTRRSTR